MIWFRWMKFRSISAGAATIAAVMAMAAPADAAVFVGLGFGLPYYGPAYIPPPIYYPPPAYYPPPPVYYTPPVQQRYAPAPMAEQSSGGQSCYAGAYVCPMDRPVAAGSSCYCLGNGGQRVVGRAN